MHRFEDRSGGLRQPRPVGWPGRVLARIAATLKIIRLIRGAS
jgi:hypothetical protein